MTFDEIMSVYSGSNGDETKAFYEKLEDFAPRGIVAINLFRACKASERAKRYRGRPRPGQPKYSAMAYDRKDWALAELCRAMVQHSDVIESWGWALDNVAIGFENVLYVDVPGAGQVSFHTGYRRDGPDYSGRWDGVRGAAPRRICRWIEAIFSGREVQPETGVEHGVPTGTKGATGERTAGEPFREVDGKPETQQALDL